MIYSCLKGCCSIRVEPYTGTTDITDKHGKKKAGAFIYDIEGKDILLVQSRGKLWGPPKGTMEEGETNESCAIREVKEETGLSVKVDDHPCIELKQRGIPTSFFFIGVKKGDLSFDKDNDVSGIMWIKKSCLEDLVSSGNIKLTYYAKILLTIYSETLPV